MRLVDSHCHLNYEGLAEQQTAVIERARAAGVTAMLNISTKRSEWAAIVATAEGNAGVWASVGVHPHDAEAHQDLTVAELIEAANHPKVIGLGETGLDYYYDKSDRAAQIACFRTHIEASRQTGLPVIIHMRDAEAAMTEIIADEFAKKGSFTGLIHCFTASQDFADKMLGYGFLISISGIVTFKNAQGLRDVAEKLPMEAMLVETDAPFLAPVPHRGKTGEPAFVRDTASFVADLRGIPLAALAEQTSDNFYRCFSKARP